MGIPSQLDGRAKGLKLRQSIVCPYCRNVIERYKKVKRGNKILLVCPMCGEVIEEEKKET